MKKQNKSIYMILDFNDHLRYLDEVNSCAGEIAAVHKKSWITGEKIVNVIIMRLKNVWKEYSGIFQPNLYPKHLQGMCGY